jgi:hypothetical protein
MRNPRQNVATQSAPRAACRTEVVDFLQADDVRVRRRQLPQDERQAVLPEEHVWRRLTSRRQERSEQHAQRVAQGQRARLDEVAGLREAVC